MEKATLAGGCFWCTEALFKRLNGVESVISGYSGGNMENPSYEKVSMGTTHHAEAIQITFDPLVISYEKLLDVFFATHNPTTLNQQGADIGTQYRSIIFYHSDEQKRKALAAKEKIAKEEKFEKDIVTEVIPFNTFYQAEEYHQNFYENNKTSPYCSLVIDPKIKKLLKEFKGEVKETYK